MMPRSRGSSVGSLGDNDNDVNNDSRRSSAATVTPDSTADTSLEVSQSDDDSPRKGKSTESAKVSQSSRRSPSETTNGAAVSGPRRAVNRVIQKIRDAASSVYNAVAPFFEPPQPGKEERRLDALLKKKTPEPNVEEIRAYDDTIYWRNNKDIKSFKRNPERYTVFEIKYDEEKKEETEKEEKYQKAKELTPLGTTVYRQPARGMCIGSQQISGAVKVVMDYVQKQAFVQLISRKSEVYATYHVKDITFLATCTPFGVAWIGDLYKADNLAPVSEKDQTDKLQRRSSLKPTSSGSQAETPGKRVTLHSPSSKDSQETADEYSRASTPSKSESPVVRRQSPAQRKQRLGSEELRKKLDELEIEDSDPTQAQSLTSELDVAGNNRSGVGNGDPQKKSTASNSEEEDVISIDVVNIVFSTPYQAQRLKSVVETLKGDSWRGTDPELETFHGSNYSSGSSSDMSLTTDATLSFMSSDSQSATPSQSLPQEATGHGDGGHRLHRSATECPLGEWDRKNYYFQKCQQHNMAVTIPSYINIDALANTQKYLQRLRNKDQCLGYYQNQFPSRNVLENNDSLQNRNVVDLRNQQTFGTQKGYCVQNQSVGNQSSLCSGNQMPPAFGNQAPWALGNQILSTFGNQMPSQDFGNTRLQKTSPRIYRNVNPTSIRKQWSASRPKPCDRIRMCLVEESDKNRTNRAASSRLRILSAL